MGLFRGNGRRPPPLTFPWREALSSGAVRNDCGETAMKTGGGVMRYVVLGVLAAALGIAGWRVFGPGGGGAGPTPESVTIPQLTAAARAGKEAFDGNCARCHGENATGTGNGPPLIHDYYNPGHHADGAFLVAMSRGVRQHHWNFGNMPPQRQVSERQARLIVRYVREMQVANGIVYKRH
jgi:mono/diheme cytochrome c family protein